MTMPMYVKTIPLLNTATVSAASTHFAAVDTKGADFVSFNVSVKSGSAAETAVTTLRVCESDTLMTAYTGGTAVTALVGAAATSTSAGFVLPARSSTTDNCYRLNCNTAGRKRYLGINFAPTLTCTNGGITITADLGRVNDGADIAVVGTATAGCRLIANG